MAFRVAGFFILAALLAPVFLKAQSPDPAILVRRAMELEKASAKDELRFAFRERVLSKDLDSSGNVRKTTEKVHDVLMIEGSPQRLLLEENGQPVSATERAGQQDFVRLVIDIRKSESPGERTKRIDAYEKKRSQFRDAIDEVPDAFTFRLMGEEMRHGRTCYVLEATPREGFEPANRYGKIFAHTIGKIWIDKATGHWLRAEGEVQETVNLGWIFVQMQKHTSAVVEQMPFSGAGWRMSYLWYRTGLRIGLFVHYRAEERASYWAYEPMSEDFLEKVLAKDYQPSLRPSGQ